jgi:hypothetical protein
MKPGNIIRILTIFLFGIIVPLLIFIPNYDASADILSSITVSAPANVPVGGSFTARIEITQGASFNSFQIQINFDQSVIQVIGSEGDTEGVSSGQIGTKLIPIDMWSFNPAGQNGGSIRILGRITGNKSISGSGYLAEIHFKVLGSTGQKCSITTNEDGNFVNGLFDSMGTRINTVTPWQGTSIQVSVPLQINTNSLPAASVENDYAISMAASGGTLPYSWNGTGLPSGLSISSSGNLSGRPAQSGDFNLIISVTDSSNTKETLSKSFSIHVYPALQILTSSLPEGTQGINYVKTVEASAAQVPFTWSAVGLPAGLIISANGTINGTPTVSGDFNTQITLSDSFITPHSINKILTIHIYAILEITTSSLPEGLVGAPYNYNPIASGGKSPYTWSASDIPAGLNINSSGTINGTPTSDGNFSIKLFVSDSLRPANTGSRELTLLVYPLLQINNTSLPEGVVAKAYNAVLTASGSTGPYSWSATGLPTGLSCSAAGAINGTPSSPGNTDITVTVTDSMSPANSINTFFKIKVNEALVITSTELNAGLIGKPYSGNLTSSGSKQPYTWTASSLPAGLTLSSNGKISGTPTAAGDFNLNVSVTDALSPSYTTVGAVKLKIYKAGDANGDGVVSVGDIIYVERVLLGLNQVTPGCDANLDGIVAINDINRINRIILGK